ncbi:unnamed protein product, partial [Ixodes persulcatus]
CHSRRRDSIFRSRACTEHTSAFLADASVAKEADDDAGEKALAAADA